MLWYSATCCREESDHVGHVHVSQYWWFKASYVVAVAREVTAAVASTSLDCVYHVIH
jgi:hypothetical protein